MDERTTRSVEGPSAAPPEADASLSRRAVILAASGAAALAVIGARRAEAIGAEPSPEPAVRARLVAGPVPDDPSHEAWSAISPVAVPLFAQQMVTPMNPEASIAEVQLRAMHDTRYIGFHLAWSDDAVDDINAMGRFTDAVAVQLPIGDPVATPVLMGAVGLPVHIVQWKASWQRQLLTGPRRVRDAFPNAVNELTPEQHLGEEASRVVYPALYVGNPAAARSRASAVEELIAEGFGTLTSQDEQRATGQGVHRDGAWSVVIRVPMSGGATQATLQPGSVTSVAIAAWDGGRRNRGARKHWANWLIMALEADA